MSVVLIKNYDDDYDDTFITPNSEVCASIVLSRFLRDIF